MAAPARTALHALRLVWRQPQTRRNFAAAARQKELDGANSSFFSSDRSTTKQHEDTSTTSDFLEPETTEYRSVSVTLPVRRFEAIDIPWPTLFSPSPSSTPQEPQLFARHRFKSYIGPREPKHVPDHPLAKGKPCDPLARLVRAGDFAAARNVYKELETLKVPIQDRFIYFPVAKSCLEKNDLEGFLFWLRLYPCRPATKDHPDLRSKWYPIIGYLLREHPLGTDFLVDFVYLAARRGLLPVVFRPLIRHLTHILSPEQSLQVLRHAMDLYKGVTLPAESVDRGDLLGVKLVEKQLEEWWNAYLKALLTAGWREAARAVHQGSVVVWEGFTERMIAEELFAREPNNAHEDAESLENDENDAPPAAVLDAEPDSLALQIRQAVRNDVRATQLARLLASLEPHLPTHPTLLSRIEACFCRKQLRSATHNTSVRRTKIWWHAMILNHRQKGDLKAVIQTFRENFLWIGLPGTPPPILRDIENSKMSPLHPSIYILTSVIPVLIDLLPPPFGSTIPAFHAAYLAQAATFPPALQPTEATHAMFIRGLLYRLGSQGGLSGILSIVDALFEPGERSFRLILRKLVKEGNVDAMHALLDLMEVHTPIRNGEPAQRLPIPSKETYQSLAWILMRKDRPEDAARVLDRAKRLYQLDIEGGVELQPMLEM